MLHVFLFNSFSLLEKKGKESAVVFLLLTRELGVEEASLGEKILEWRRVAKEGRFWICQSANGCPSHSIWQAGAFAFVSCSPVHLHSYGAIAIDFIKDKSAAAVCFVFVIVRPAQLPVHCVKVRLV